MLKRFLFLFSAAFGFAHFSVAQEIVSPPEKTITKTGYCNTTEVDFSKGFLENYNVFSVGLHTINGYRFNEHISAGIGIGADQYFYYNEFNEKYQRSTILLPVFTDVRIYIGKGKTQPFFSQAAGYSIFLHQPGYDLKSADYRQIGGIFINPSFGLSIPMDGDNSFNISLGYRLQELTVNRVDDGLNQRDGSLSSMTWKYHFINLKTGLTF